MFQFHHLLPAFSALENVMLPGLMRHGATRPSNAQRHRVAHGGRARRRIAQAAQSELSGGCNNGSPSLARWCWRLALVLADEPTGNLDTRTADGVFELMRQFNETRGTAFLVVTHDPRLAARCDRVIELRDGTIVRDAPQQH